MRELCNTVTRSKTMDKEITVFDSFHHKNNDILALSIRHIKRVVKEFPAEHHLIFYNIIILNLKFKGTCFQSKIYLAT